MQFKVSVACNWHRRPLSTARPGLLNRILKSGRLFSLPDFHIWTHFGFVHADLVPAGVIKLEVAT